MNSNARLSYRFYMAVVLLNIVLSALIFIYPEPINIDGILYLHAAQVYLQQGLHAATAVYPWPFYSVFIGKVSNFFHINLFNSGLLCNSVLTSLLIVYFLRIIPLLGGLRRHQGWAFAILLLYPFLNLDRFYILRDFGYYAFYIASLFYFIQFLNHRKTLDGLLWQISLFIASLFRIEGIILLGLIPLFYLISNIKKISLIENIKNCFKLSSLSLGLILIALIFFSHHLHYGRLSEVQSYFDFHSLINIFNNKLIILQDKVLGDLGKDNGVIFLIGGIIGVFILTLCQTLGIFYTLLTAVGFYQKILPSKISSSGIQGISLYFAAMLCILFAFMCHLFFLSDRYIIPLSLLFLLGLPFVIEHFWQKNQLMGKAVICCILIYNAVASFGHFGHSKNYIVKAGNWIHQYETTQKDPYYVITPDAQLAFYANTIATPIPKNLSNLNSNLILAIIQNAHQDSLIQENIKPTKIFENHAGDKALIYVLPSTLNANKKGTPPT